MLDKWMEISYYRFPSFNSVFERDAYESWDEYLDEHDIYYNDNMQYEGEDECLD